MVSVFSAIYTYTRTRTPALSLKRVVCLLRAALHCSCDFVKERLVTCFKSMLSLPQAAAISGDTRPGVPLVTEVIKTALGRAFQKIEVSDRYCPVHFFLLYFIIRIKARTQPRVSQRVQPSLNLKHGKPISNGRTLLMPMGSQGLPSSTDIPNKM